MPLSRNHRQDRRRRAMLDSLAQDADLAVENVRARRRLKSRAQDDDEDTERTYRDPGYSQAVRSACQQRIVQFIPVRRGTVAIVLTGLWLAFGMLLFTHYWIHTSSKLPAAAALTNLPIGHLFHLRSPHGIAHWLTSQLWLLTALASWMIFNLRRHKLDDYRARYRIWVFIALAALFSSFDASTSILQLIGMSIDGWARREIGYGGWPLVLASFASLIGVLGIRLSSELRSVPTSVVSWILGLVAWAVSALLGTGLLKVTMPMQQLDLLVGGLWLGGILAVFQSAAMYLRTTYIQAQKRFLQRQGCELGPLRWKVPSIKVPSIGLPRRNRETIDGNESVIAKKTKGSRSESDRGSDRDDNYRDEHRDEQFEKSSRRGWAFWKRKQKDELDGEQHEEVYNSKKSSSEVTSTKEARRLFGLIPNRHLRNEELEYEPIAEDEGGEVDTGLTKTSGWFGIGGNKKSTAEAKQPTKSVREKPRRQEEGEGDEPLSKNKGSWWRKGGNRDASDTQGDRQPAPKGKRKWMPPMPAIPKVSLRGNRTTGEGEPNADEKPTRRGFFKRNRNTEGADAESANKSLRRKEKLESSGEGKVKKSWFGMFDGLTLKPPKSQSSNQAEQEPSKPGQSRPSPGPAPIKAGASIPSTRDYDDEEESDSRPMSKAERKRLRRQQDDRRAA